MVIKILPASSRAEFDPKDLELDDWKLTNYDKGKLQAIFELKFGNPIAISQ